MNNDVVQFNINSKSGVPVYRQIIQQIEQAILGGLLEPGDQLPTIRSLSIKLKINPNTIAKAYTELEIKEILITQVGRGTFVSEKKINTDELERKKKAEELTANYLEGMQRLGMDKHETLDFIRDFKED